MALVFEPNPADRPVEVEWDGKKVKFILDPESLSGNFQAMSWAENQEIFDPEKIKSMGTIAAGFFALVRRIKAWEGIENPDGQPLPCTQEIKEALFGKFPGLLMALSNQLQADLAAEEKNLKASRPGSGD